MKSFRLNHRSIRRILTIASVTVVATSLAIPIVIPIVIANLSRPALIKNAGESIDSILLVPHSVDNSRQIVAEAAPIMSHCFKYFPDGWYPLKPSTMSEVLNCAMNLAQSRNANAEYIIGWMYENNLSVSFPGNFKRTIDDISQLGRGDPKAAVDWYERARAHGSPEASRALGCLKEFIDRDPTKKREISRLYEEAIARGNEDAKIDLGRCCEDLNTDIGAKKAMALYEEALKAKSVYTVNSAIIEILKLWRSNRAQPSVEFTRGKPSALAFFSKFDPKADQERFDMFFRIACFTPDIYAQYRAEILPKIRHSLGLSSDSPAARIVSFGLKDDNQDVRVWSRNALRDLGDGAASELTRLLKDSSSETRLECLKALTAGGSYTAPGISKMIDLLVNDPDDRIRQEAKIALRSIGRAAEPSLRKPLDNPAARIRTDSAEDLAYVGTKDDVPALVKLLQAPEEEVYSAAAHTLSTMGADAEPAMPTLIAWLQYPEKDTRYRVAHHAICMNLKAAAVPALVHSIQSEASESQRIKSTRCLCDLGRSGGDAAPALIELTHSEKSQKLRLYFVDALAFTSSNHPDAISALKLLAQTDQRPDIRHQAAMRLDEVSKGLL